MRYRSEHIVYVSGSSSQQTRHIIEVVDLLDEFDWECSCGRINGAPRRTAEEAEAYAVAAHANEGVTIIRLEAAA